MLVTTPQNSIHHTISNGHIVTQQRKHMASQNIATEYWGRKDIWGLREDYGQVLGTGKGLFKDWMENMGLSSRRSVQRISCTISG